MSQMIAGTASQPGAAYNTTRFSPAETPLAEPAAQGDTPVPAARLASALLQEGWGGVASSGSYGQLFGSQSYVKSGSDPQLLSMLQHAIDRSPELQGTALAQRVQSGRVGPEDVKTLQSFLESKGFSVGAPGQDGKYGPLTHKALESFLSGQQGAAARGQQPGEADRTQPPTRDQAEDAPPARPDNPATEDNAAPKSKRTGPPEGYRSMRGAVPKAVVERARSLLGGEMGTETPFEIDGERYVARTEPHYHPPGYKGGPTGWHKGVTVYEAAD